MCKANWANWANTFLHSVFPKLIINNIKILFIIIYIILTIRNIVY